MAESNGSTISQTTSQSESNQQGPATNYTQGYNPASGFTNTQTASGFADTQTASGFTYDRSPQENNSTEATADVPRSSPPSEMDYSGQYWLNPPSEFKWEFNPPSSSSQPLTSGARLSILVGLTSCILLAVGLEVIG